MFLFDLVVVGVFIRFILIVVCGLILVFCLLFIVSVMGFDLMFCLGWFCLFGWVLHLGDRLG